MPFAYTTDRESDMNNIYSLLLFFFSIFAPYYLQAQTISGELKQWHKVTLSFAGPSTTESSATNPFLDYKLEVTFTNGLEQFVVPGYYAADGNAAETSASSGNVWRAHFVPNIIGTWTYSVSFRTGTNIAISDLPLAGTPILFDGTTGSFDILPTDKSGNDFRGKGLMQVVDNHYFRFAGNGEYFIKSGTNSPENLLGYFEFDNTVDNGGIATPGLVDGLHQYVPHIQDWNPGDPVWQGTKGKGIIGALNYLASQEVNSIYFLTYNTDGGDGQETYMWNSPDDKLRYDCSKLDQWEIVFSHADSLGIQLHVVTQETENNTAMDSLSIERKLYYRELVARFGHHLSIQWNIGEENTNSDLERIAFANYIKSLDPYDHPIAIHSVFDEASTYFDRLLGQAGYDAASIQGLGNRYNEWAIELRADSDSAGRKWAIYGDEQAPEVQPDASNIDKLREIYWDQLLGGGAGVEWYFGYQDTFGDVQSEDFRPVEILWQQTALARQFWQQYVPYFEMQPNNALGQTNTRVFHRAADLFLMYIPVGGSKQLDITGAVGKLPIQWFDPRNGGELLTGTVDSVQGNGWVDIGNPPIDTGNDWVAMIGNSNRAPGFRMQPSALLLNMNFADTASAMASLDQLAPGEIDQEINFSISPDSISFAEIFFVDSTGEFKVVAIADSVGEQNFTITANDGQDFNTNFTQNFLLRISPPTPPEAQFAATPVVGFVPLSVNLDASASFDNNGPIVAYDWNFDGVATSSGLTANYTYRNPGTYQARLIVTDEDGMTDTAYQQILVEEMPQEILFVANSTDLNAGDQVVVDHLEANDYTVIVIDQNAATAADALDKGLVMISSSVSSSAVNTKFKAVAIPVLTWESYLYDDMGMTPGGNGSGFGTEWNDNNISIIDEAHYLAAGLTGTQLLLQAGNGLNWGNPTNTALKIGTVPGEVNKALLFAYEDGGTMSNGIAPARRVGIFMRDNSVVNLSPQGWQLFDNAVCWAMGCAASNPVNQPPVITALANQQTEQGDPVSLSVQANDPEGDIITFSATGLPQGLSINPTTGQISGTVSAAINTYSVTITATDNGDPNESASISFQWIIIEPIPNMPPSISPIGNQTDFVGAEISLPVTAVDPEGHNITFSATGLPLGLLINSLSGVISGTITGAATIYNVEITATDDGDPNESSSMNFSWTTNEPPPNQAPVLANIGNQSSEQQAQINIPTGATDPDGDNLTFSAQGLPQGLNINPNNGRIIGTITANPGLYPVTVTVSDDGSPSLSDSENFTWEVTELVIPLETIWLEAECASYGLDWGEANDLTAAEGIFLSTQAGFINSGNIQANHLISLEVNADIAGNYDVWMRIKTSGGFNSLWQQNGVGWSKLDFPNLSNWTWFKVLNVNFLEGTNILQFAKREGAFVDKVVCSIEAGFSPTGTGDIAINCSGITNNPPVISSIADQADDPGANISLQVFASDPDGDNLTYSAQGLPNGLSIGNTSGLITGILTAGTGLYAVTVTVSDDGNPSRSTSTTFDWIVNGDPSEILDNWQMLGQEPDDRLENAYVKLGDAFFRFGGISENDAHWYNPLNDSWNQDVTGLPMSLHHVQGVVLDEILYVVSAWTGNNSNPSPVSHVYMYDAAASPNDRWIQSIEIPANRRRGSAGVAVYEGKIYIAGGVENGHGAQADSKNWFDVFDPLTGTWQTLPDMPRVRDHFHGAVIGDKFYAAGGRNTGVANYINATYTEIDVFDFNTQTWSTIAPELPEGRGGTMTAVLDHRLLIIGGETGQALAHTNTDLLNTQTLNWLEITELPEGRHGGQAVVCDSSVFIAGGAKVNGIGTEVLDQLVLHYGDIPNQNIVPIQTSSLVSSPNPVDFGNVEQGGNPTLNAVLSITGGNQAIIIDNIFLSGSNVFSSNLNLNYPIVLGIGQQLQVPVELNAQNQGSYSGQINISHQGGSTSIPISAEVLSTQNLAPTLAFIPAQNDEQGEAASLQLSATDPNPGDILTFSASNLPLGLSINQSTGLISGTITGPQGAYSVTANVTDNGTPQLSDSQSFTWVVSLPHPNQAPTINPIADQNTEQNKNASLQVVASDPDGDNLSYAASGLPATLSINPTTGLISGNVSAATGTYPITITVTDDGDPNLSANTSFNWVVSPPPPNQAPVVDPIADQSNEQFDNVSLQVIASDPDGDALSYQATGLPLGISVNAQSGLISGTIIASPGNYPVDITVSDDGTPSESTTISFNWEVLEQVIPLTTIWLEGECADFGSDWQVANDPAAAEGQYVSTTQGFVNSGNINANHIISFNVQAEETDLYACWIRIQTSGGFNSLWQNVNGNWIKNDFASYGTWTWVQVENVNLNAGLNQVQFAKREGAFVDKMVVSKEVEFAPNLTGDPAQNCGPVINVAPEISPITDQSSGEGTTPNLQIIATDANGDQLTYQANGLPAGLTINPLTGLINGQLTAPLGSYPVTITVTDDGDPVLDATANFTWEIIEFVPPTGGNILFVVSYEPMIPGDQAIHDHLVSNDHTVTVVPQADAETATTAGMDAILISSTVSSGMINTIFTNTAVPLMCWEPYLYDDLGMTGTGAFSDFGNSNTSVAIDIQDATHPLAAGLQGTAIMSTLTTGLAWGIPNANALNIATLSDQPTSSGIFAYEAGSAMVGLTAPARRMGFALRDGTAAGMTAEGWALFDAAICWLMDCGVQAREGFILPSAQASLFKLSPNPFSKQLRIGFESSIHGQMKVQLMDLAGKIVQKWMPFDASGRSSLDLEVGELAEGVYVIRVEFEGRIWEEKVVKR